MTEEYLKINFLVILVLVIFSEEAYGKFTYNGDDSYDCSDDMIRRGPSSKSVVSNKSTSLACFVANAKGAGVQWVKDGFGLGHESNLPLHDRYTMGSGVEENYSLNITGINLEDQANYTCQVTLCKLESNVATLTVYVSPDKPIIDNEIDGIVDIFTRVTNKLICRANNAKPAAKVQWNSIDRSLLNSNVTVTRDGELHNTTSVYTFVPSKQDNGAIYVCTVDSDALLLSGQLPLREKIVVNTIETPTNFTMDIANTSTIVIDANEVRDINCTVENTGSATSISWYRGNELNQTLGCVNTSCDGTCNISISISITANDINEEYSCRLNIPGSSRNYTDELTFTISVYYTPADFPYGAVIGGSVGVGILLILLIILLIFCVRRSSKKEREEKELRSRNMQTFTNEGATEREEEQRQENLTAANITTTEAELKRRAAADQGNDSGTETSKSEYQTSESESDTDESVKPPSSGETFCRTSSMLRSDRGSPIIMYSDFDSRNSFSEDDSSPYIPSPNTSMPQYYTREIQRTMVTDV